MDFLKQVRMIHITPILILSAKNSEVDKALGLGFGADDYLTKPFSLIELTARIQAMIRKATIYANQASETDLVYKDIRLNMDHDVDIL